MSAIRAKIRPVTKIAGCADPGSIRYALGAVQIVPRKDGVYAAATDGRCLAIIEAEGQATGTHLLPAEMVKIGCESSLNGRWETVTPATKRKPASVTTADPTEGRFPKCADIVPQVVADEAGLGLNGFGGLRGQGFQVLHIDAALLAKIGEALNGSEGPRAVTLLVPIQDNRLHNVTAGIPVVGLHGIGVLMPLGLGDNRSDDTAEGLRVLDRFEAIRAGYAEAEKANPRV